MSAGTMVVASSIGNNGGAALERAYAALYQESKRSRRVSRSALELGLRCSNLAVWMYAGVQFAQSMS